MLDLKKQELPHLIRVRQHFPTDCISDIPAAVRQELDKLTLDDKCAINRLRQPGDCQYCNYYPQYC